MTGKREANKKRTRGALVEAAWALIDQNGYEKTTVATIAARVEVSERTFYRYFDSKEAVLFQGWREQLDEFESFVRSRPKDEDILASLQEFSRAWALATQGDLPRIRRLHAIAEDSQAVREYENTHIMTTLRTRLAAVVAERLDKNSSESSALDFRPELLAGLFIQLLSSTKKRWMASGGSLSTYVEAAWSSAHTLGLRRQR